MVGSPPQAARAELEQRADSAPLALRSSSLPAPLRSLRSLFSSALRSPALCSLGGSENGRATDAPVRASLGLGYEPMGGQLQTSGRG
eukprot:gene11275-biopygen5297